MTTRLSTQVRRGAVALVLATVASGLATVAAPAPSGAALPTCTKTWTTAVSGSWDDGTKWTDGTVPTDEDHVCITTAGTYTVTLADPGDPVGVASLRVGTASGATTQTLVVSRGVDTEVEDSLYADEGLEISARGVVELGESATASVSIGAGCGCEGIGITNAGTIRQASGSDEDQSIYADVLNTGTIDNDQPLRIEGSLTNQGTGLVQADDVLHVSDRMWTKGGSVRGEGLVSVHGELLVGDGDTDPASGAPAFTVEDGMLTIQADSPIAVVARGAVLLTGSSHPGQEIIVQSVEDGGAALFFSGTFTNGGSLTLQPGDIDGEALLVGPEPGATVVNEGTIDRYDAGTADAVIVAELVNRGSVVTTDDTLFVAGDLENEGVLDLGFGGLDVDGDVELEASGTVAVDVDGNDGPAQRIFAAGAATVDGLLDVETDTAPSVGMTHTLIDSTARTGTFAEVAFAGSASYDVGYTATQVDLTRRASESASRRFVRAAYQDFLDRQPTTTELNQRATALDGGTLTRAALVRELSRTPEYITALVQRFYADTLGRPGDPDGVAFWVDQLRTGRKTVAQVAGSFYASPEYFTRAGGTNQAWITDLYEVFFDRAPSGADLTYWTGRIATRGRTGVAVELFQSLESRRQRVERLYQDLLHRAGDADGVDYWADRITTEGDLALAVFLAASGEYNTLAQQRYP